MHTIIFARWPLQSSTSNLAPREIECENFPIAYASCGESWVHQRVDEAIVEFKANLVPAGPELARGCLSLGFYERRHNKVGRGVVHACPPPPAAINLPPLLTSRPHPTPPSLPTPND